MTEISPKWMSDTKPQDQEAHGTLCKKKKKQKNYM